MVLFLFSLPVYGGSENRFRFVRKLMQIDNRKIARIADQIPEDFKSERIDVTSLKTSLPDISLTALTPDILRLASVGGHIVDSSTFSDGFLNQSPDPAEIIFQYLKYGEPYLRTAQTFSETVSMNSQAPGNAVQAGPRKLSNISEETIQKFQSEPFSNLAFVSIVRRTGRFGYETIERICDWVIGDPAKSEQAAILLIWFSTDPEGFIDTLGDISQYLARGAPEIVVGSTQEAGKGATSFLAGMWNDSTTRHVIAGILVLLAILAFYFRTTRKIISFPFRIAVIKIRNSIHPKKINMVQGMRFQTKRDLTPDVSRGEPLLGSSRTQTNSDSTDQAPKGLF
jgi:hypothetical protein